MEEKKGGKLIPIIIGAGVLLLIIVIGLQVFVILQMTASKTGEVTASKTGEAVEGNKEGTNAKKKLIQIADIVPVSIVDKNIYTLAPDSSGDQYTLRLTVQLGFNSKSKEYTTKKTLIESKLPIVNDIIDSTIRVKTYDNAKKDSFTDELKKEILVKLNEKFDTDVLVDMYFYDFYVQMIP